MADQQQLERLEQGVETWNQWRKAHPDEDIDLSRANLSYVNLSRADLTGANLILADLFGANLSRANLSETNLSGADLSGKDFSYVNLNGAILSGAILNGAILSGAKLSGANLSGVDLSGKDLSRAKLSGAKLSGANLSGVDLSGKDLSGTDLSGANLSETNLSRITLDGANLSKANLTRAIVVEANLNNAVLSSCSIYGIAAWDVQLEGAKQEDLVITLPNQPMITVDNLKIAQFIYLLLNNKEIRDVIDTITSKVVLILGRFTSERKRVLDALREELRNHDYLPILFDFEKPTNRDITETVSTLAHIARFVIADITEANVISSISWHFCIR